EHEPALLLQQILDRGGADQDQLISPVRRMLEHDDRTGTEFAKSVLMFLAEAGIIATASEKLKVHPNTLRHRLQRAEELFGVDLEHADMRLAVWLQLRLLTRRRRL
ncbi:MAG: helix-turn-helix domain-containing protein, partial [Microbacterium sp.]